MFFDIVGNLVLSVLGSSVWALLGYALYRRERRHRAQLACFSLFSTLDRLGDALAEIAEDGSNLEEAADLRYVEESLQRRISAFQFEWLIENLPHESEGVVWMHDLAYVIDNSREIISEIAEMRHDVEQGLLPSPGFDAMKQAGELRAAIEQQKKLLQAMLPRTGTGGVAIRS